MEVSVIKCVTRTLPTNDSNGQFIIAQDLLHEVMNNAKQTQTAAWGPCSSKVLNSAVYLDVSLSLVTFRNT